MSNLRSGCAADDGTYPMSRTREIKPAFFIDEELASQVCRDARFLFIGLWTIADRDGIMEDRPARIKAQVYPYEEDLPVTRVDELLAELDAAPGDFVRRYEVDGKRYLWVRTLSKNQHFHPKERPIGYPHPPTEKRQARSFPGKPDLFPARDYPNPASKPEPSVSSVSSEPSKISSTHTPRAILEPNTTEYVAPSAEWKPPCNEPSKPTAYNVVYKFLAIRAEMLGGASGVGTPFMQPQRGDVEKAVSWLSSMDPPDVEDIEPAIRLACKHVVAGDSGWTKPEMTKVGYLWAAILRNWTDLREEIHGCAPVQRPPPAHAKGMAPVPNGIELLGELEVEWAERKKRK